MHVFKRLRRFFLPYIAWGLGSVLAMACLTAAGLVRPWLLEQLIDRVIRERRFAELPYWTAAVLVVALVRGVFNFLRQYLGHVFGQNATFDLRNALYDKLQYLHFKFYDNAYTGDLMSRVTADVEAFRMFLSFGWVHLMDMLFMTLFSLVLMLSMSVRLTMVTLLVMPFLLVVVLRFERQVRPAFTRVREALAGLSTAAQENLNGMRTVKSFAREPFEVEKFAAHNREYLEANLATTGLWARYFPVIELLSNLALIVLLAYGGLLVLQSELSLGELVAFNSLIWYWIVPMREIGYRINELTQAIASGERLLEVLEHPVAVQSPPNPVRLPAMKGHVRFEGVWFQYDSPQPGTGEVSPHPALADITIDAPPGSVIGIIGATGSGKSTLVSLIPRFYDVTRGRVTIDGIDVRDLDLDDLRRQIGIVQQETFLWSASIRENIAYGRRSATMEEIVAAAKLARAHDFIMETPNGYDTIIGERGLGLSGGQRQRIAIARAILNNPRILILDDATASVDMETEHEIQLALQNAMRGRTTFIIAHRLSAVKHADEILVLDRGRIVERGTHEELLARGGIYRSIYDLQFRDYEEQRAKEAAKGGSR